MNREQLVKFSVSAARFADPLLATMAQYKISTPERACMFIAQVAHESGDFKYVAENLNYSADALLRVFPKYFPSRALAEQYARQPEKIASRVYAGRMGNGPEESGDGWRFRGHGLIQVTGKDNHRQCSVALFGDDRLLREPELLMQPAHAAASAGWFWQSRELNALADADRFEDITRKINGGLNGQEDRVRLLEKARAIVAAG